VSAASTAGNEVRAGFAQVGYTLGKQSDIAIYGSTSHYNQSGGTSVFKAFDETVVSQGGFRFDQAGETTTVSVTGDYRQAEEQNQAFMWTSGAVDRTLVRDYPHPKGAHLKGRIVRKLAGGGELAVGAYHDYTNRKTVAHEDSIRTSDYDIQYSRPIGSANTIMVGAEYRKVSDNLIRSYILSFGAERAISEWYTGFIQDELHLLDGRLSLLFGSKIERNDFTSTQLQPSVRGVYSLSDSQSVWAAVSRVTRTPFRTENGGTLLAGQARAPLGLTGYGLLTGSPGVERWLTYEVGYRGKPLSSVTLDATTFISRSQSLDLAVKGDPYLGTYLGTPGVIQPYDFGSYGKVQSMGLELSGSILPTDYAHIQAWYTYLNVDINSLAVGNFPLSPERSSPRHSGYVRSLINLTTWLDFDTHVRAVGRLQDLPGVHGYTELGTRLAARISPNWELAIGGDNLLNRRHVEFADTIVGITPSAVERSFYARLRYRLGKDF
jgi:iron complex outermembrane receptor protein